jgi:hypothetical protein
MTNHMGSEASRKQWFELMLPLIPYCAEDQETWISGKALQAAAGLTEHRRSAGINWGRRNYSPGQDWALVSGRRGYRFVATTKQAAPFVLPRYKSIETLLAVTYLGAQKPLVNRAIAAGRLDPMVAQMIERSVERAMQDIDALRMMI